MWQQSIEDSGRSFVSFVAFSPLAGFCLVDNGTLPSRWYRIVGGCKLKAGVVNQGQDD